MTMIARVVDGLPLVGTMQDDEQVSSLKNFVHVGKFHNFSSYF